MPSRAGRSARGLGSGRGGTPGGAAGKADTAARPLPVLSGALGGRLRPRRHASLPSAPLWGGGLRPGAERRPRGEGARPRGRGEAGGGQARGAPLWRTPGDRARCAVPRPGGCRCRRAGRRGRRRRPAGSWRERGAGPLPSVQTTAPTAARCSGCTLNLPSGG